MTGEGGAYRLLLALGALDAAGYSLIVPVIPEIADASGAGPATLGLLVAAFPAGMMAGFWLAGRAVERRGVRPVLVGALALIALGALGFVLTDSLTVYFVSRLVMGVGSAGLWIGVTLDTLERWPGQEYVCMSRIFAAYSIGGLVGPALGAVGGTAGPFTLYLVLVAGGHPARASDAAAGGATAVCVGPISPALAGLLGRGVRCPVHLPGARHHGRHAAAPPCGAPHPG